MDNPLIYIILNGELKMSSGKAAAQTAHAMASLHNANGISLFAKRPTRTVVVLEAVNQLQINNLEWYLNKLDIPAEAYIDEGVNEVMPFSVTAIAIGPIAADDKETRYIFSSFPLYGKKKRWYQR